MMSAAPTAISLFTSGGIGDLALREAGYRILVSSELLTDRHSVFQHNFPDTLAISGDIRTNVDAIAAATRSALGGGELELLYATPPCQGMSKNGRGKLLSVVRAGLKPPMDERNRLIIPTMALARRLRPETVLLENVPEMAETVIITHNGTAARILDYIASELGPEYRGSGEVVEFADYGVPQCRQRLITVFSRHPRMKAWFEANDTFIPPPTHSRFAKRGQLAWVTLRDVIGGLPPLDATSATTASSSIPYHRVPVLDELKYWWVSNTPPDKSAFDNQCVSCGFAGNLTHSARKDKNGINRTSKQTPLHCAQCGKQLPRPSVVQNGRPTIMRGFTSAYKRMSFDKPASALTRNLSYACSDNKVHPEQNRVLSLYEAFRIHTVDQFRYDWKRTDGKTVSDKTIREIIGESIPPLGLLRIVQHLVDIRLGRAKSSHQRSERSLFELQGTGI